MTRAVVAMLVFLGVSAVGGGVAMLLAPDGSLIGMDPEVLAAVPMIEGWLVPGLFLSVVLGAGSLATVAAVVRRPHLPWAARLERATGVHVSWVATVGLGVVLIVFILYEATIVTAPEGRWLQWLMGGLGVAVVALGISAPVRRDLRQEAADGSLRDTVIAHPVGSYLAVTFALSWAYWGVVLGVLGRDGLGWFLPGAFAPGVGAVVVTAVTEGRAGVRHLLGRLIAWRVAPRWYAFVLVGLPAIGGLLGIHFSDGTERFSGPFPTVIVVYVTTLVFLIVLGGGQEELGWRGFALPHMQAASGPLRASVALGLLWGMWHLPVFVFVPNYNNAGTDVASVATAFAVFTLAGTVGQSLLLTWLWNRTGRSVLLAVLAHGSLNAGAGFVAADQSASTALFVAYAVVGAAVAVATRGQLGHAGGRAAVPSDPEAESRAFTGPLQPPA